MSFSDHVSNALRTLSSSMQTPVMVVLLILAGTAIILLGTLIVEVFTERRTLTAQLPLLLNRIKAEQSDPRNAIRQSGLLKRQIKSLLLICSQDRLTPDMRESLAVSQLFNEKEHYDTIVKVTDIIAKLAPMFGLLGTLIPLGPGILALGSGDTQTLSTSLLIAFDTTVAGLLTAAVASVISAIRKKWYLRYNMMLKTVMEALLEVLDEEACSETVPTSEENNIVSISKNAASAANK